MTQNKFFFPGSLIQSKMNPRVDSGGNFRAENKAKRRGKRYCPNLEICITADGTWFHAGRPIIRFNLVKFFAGLLERDEDGCYWLVTPVEMGIVFVEDVPFVGVELLQEVDCLKVRTNIDDIITIDAQHPLKIVVDPITKAPRPYLTVRNNLWARLSRSVFYQLVESATKSKDGYMTVISAGQEFILGSLEDE